MFFFRIPAQVDSEFPRALLILLSPPHPSYELHPEDPLEVDNVPFEFCIAGFTRILFGSMRKMKREMMVVEAFVLFFPVTIELNGGS